MQSNQIEAGMRFSCFFFFDNQWDFPGWCSNMLPSAYLPIYIYIYIIAEYIQVTNVAGSHGKSAWGQRLGLTIFPQYYILILLQIKINREREKETSSSSLPLLYTETSDGPLVFLTLLLFWLCLLLSYSQRQLPHAPSLTLSQLSASLTGSLSRLLSYYQDSLPFR